MSTVTVFVALLVIGMVLSTLVYTITQALGSNDPFAIELACWWIFTDLVVLSKLRNWKLQSAHEWVQLQPHLVLSALVAAGVVVVIVAVLLTLINERGQFVVLDRLAGNNKISYILRSNLARSLVSFYCGLHLALFLA
jgi:hypothetical protein